MAIVFIIHGSNGKRDDHWYPWLSAQLTNKGIEVIRLQFPTHEKQNLRNWLETLMPYKEKLTGSILIGHSLGVPFILNVLNQWKPKIKASFLVSGFVGHLDVKGEPNLPDFAERNFDWKEVNDNCDQFYIFHSDNDPYVPLQKAEELANLLKTKVILVKDGAHFQVQSGFETFELLLSSIEGTLE